ncbi:Pr6Pr family membrane protein [Microbacterium sediminis]|uniref:Pr6Pr family membrane protein n=1 Tax=Microbacterium sediminis TaxID=904291 RepID=UPI001F0A457D|nr:Pr6Pr family membrane protein [Microbacterium sediminis]
MATLTSTTRTPVRTTTWSVLRIAAAALILAAAFAQLARTLRNAVDNDFHLPTSIANFFSFFTIESNLFAAIVLVIAAVRGWTRREDRDPAWLSIALAAVSTFMIITGIVYNLLLRGIELPQGQTVAWSNEVLHVVGPLFLLLDVLFAPRRRGLPWATIGIVVMYPIVWAVYTLVRANLITNQTTGDPWWYPYPFLNPHVQGGYGGVALYIVGIAAAFALVAWGIVAVGRRRDPLTES